MKYLFFQQARVQSKPDPYVVASVGKNSEQTQVQMRTDCPVWEQGYTFLVANPDNDGLYLKVSYIASQLQKSL